MDVRSLAGTFLLVRPFPSSCLSSGFGWRLRGLWVGFTVAAIIACCVDMVSSPLRAAAAVAAQPEWPQWRGPLGNSTSDTARPPTRWSESSNVRWKTRVPGTGHSSPIISGDRVYVLTAEPVGDAKPPVLDSAPGVHDSVPVTHTHRYDLLSIERASGRIAWRRTLAEAWPHEGGHTTGSPLSQSPVTDGRRIYAHLGSRGLYCLDTNGTVLWKTQLGRMLTHHAHGEGSSPILWDSTLVINWDAENGSFLAAFDKISGRQLWKTPRSESTSWSTPLAVSHQDQVQIIVSATPRLRAYDLRDGRQIWECTGLTDNVVSSPVYGDGIVVAGNSYARQSMVAVRLDGAKGDISESDRVAWRLGRLTPYVSSPLLYGKRLYFLRHNQNVLSRLDPATGQMLGDPIRLTGIQDFIFSSPVGADGRIYVPARDGVTVVLKHDSQNEILAVNRLDDRFSASPALAGRELFLRGEKFLYCLAGD